MRDFFCHNLGLKFISLALAIGLWQVVRHDPVGEIALDVPIEFRNLPENMEISTENIPRAEIRLRGPERLLRNLSRADVHANVDVRGLRPGERTFDLNGAQINRPRGLEIVQVVPSQFRLEFDFRANKKVAVRPRVMGNFAPGYRMGEIRVEPSEVLITGPRKRVEAIEAAITDPIDASGTTVQATFVRHAYVSDPLVQVSDTNPVRVTVMMDKTSASAEQH
jgi:YbbR domain-containing protein